MDVVRRNPDRLHVVGLVAARSRDNFARQVVEFRPDVACLVADSTWDCPPGTRRATGMEGVIDLVTSPSVDLVVFASAGQSGFRPLLAAIEAGKQIALANKEALIMAGELVMTAAHRHGITIRPVDSEHSAIWQCLQGEARDGVESLTLTASGGPFRTWPASDMAGATAADALRHPTWSMGDKITIDSATLMNKGLEVIEAHWLFGMPYDHIDVVVHPQSIVHSLVSFADGSFKAQLGTADMRTPIQYALSWPHRWAACDDRRVDLSALGHLDFETPDADRFPCLRLAREAGAAGGTYPTVLCAADDVAVAAYLQGQIGWSVIACTIDTVLQLHQSCGASCLDDIIEADNWARRTATDVLTSA